MTEIDQAIPATPAAPAAPVSQATSIEQSRAVAEVQAAVVVAQQRPRNVQAALAELEEVCKTQELADRAFFRYNRAGSQISGPTIHLAREIARIWGNITYGIAELSRDETAGRSEVIAWAWDLQTNTRASNTFISPHRRDTKDGPKVLTDMRDIYESNTNYGARRAREMIFAVLPTWLVDRAKELCSKTLRDGGGVPLAQRIADARRQFTGRWGVTLDQLESKLGRSSDRWTDHDMAALRVIWKSLERGETTVDDEFAPERVTAAEIAGQQSAEPATVPDGPAPAEPAEPEQQAEQWPEVVPPGSGGKASDA